MEIQALEISDRYCESGKECHTDQLYGTDFTGFKNHKDVPGVTNEKILDNARNIQSSNPRYEKRALWSYVKI